MSSADAEALVSKKATADVASRRMMLLPVEISVADFDPSYSGEVGKARLRRRIAVFIIAFFVMAELVPAIPII